MREGAWVVRDNEGKVLLHSRIAFGKTRDVVKAKFRCLKWGIESMQSHRISKVIFAFDDLTFVGLVNCPRLWPSFRYQSQELKRSLRDSMMWKMIFEPVEANRGANLIAQSVTNDSRLQSYVATGHPSWLQGVFEDERVSSSL